MYGTSLALVCTGFTANGWVGLLAGLQGGWGSLQGCKVGGAANLIEDLLDSISTVVLSCQMQGRGTIHVPGRYPLLHVATETFLQALHVPVQCRLVRGKSKVCILLEVIYEGLTAGGRFVLLLPSAVQLSV